jgi:serine/threonine-protein kinase
VIEKLGRYQITGELGRGGGGVVYSAVDPESGAAIALKTVPTESFGAVDHQMLISRLKREAKSLATLDHPNIVKMIDLDEDEGRTFIVMELVSGHTLEQALRKGETFAPERVVRIIAEVAHGLDYAHRRGITHRDVKPANLMLTPEGQVKIMDFGTVKLQGPQYMTQLTETGTMIGSTHYMSPEQVTESGVDGRSDQFSLAVIAYELLAGTKPFSGDMAPAVMFQITSAKHPAPTSLKPELPAELEAVFDRALAKERNSRYLSCMGFAKDLAAALKVPLPELPGAPAAQQPAPASTPVPITKPAASPAGGKNWWIITAVAVLAVLIVVLLLMRK